MDDDAKRILSFNDDVLASFMFGRGGGQVGSLRALGWIFGFVVVVGSIFYWIR